MADLTLAQATTAVNVSDNTNVAAVKPASTAALATDPALVVAVSPNAGLSTATNQATEIANLATLNSLVPTQYDYISLGYTGANLTTVLFKLGGSGGTLVSTLTLAYTGSVLNSVTKT